MYTSQLIIAGSRDLNINHYKSLVDLLDKWVEKNGLPTHVFSGMCRGVDQLGELWAFRNNFPVVEFPYDKALGKAGGPIRNSRMVKEAEGGAVVLYTTRAGLGFDRGSKDLLYKAERKFGKDNGFVMSGRVDI